MAERKKVGIVFNYSEGWIGGTYYFINLVNALLSLNDEAKPEVMVVSDDENSFNKIQATGYPYLSRLKAHFHYSIAERVLNKSSRIFTGKNLIFKGHSEKLLPLLFRYYEQLPYYKCNRKLYWIPDLQDCYYPEYVGKNVALSRKKQHRQLAYSNTEIVFSSETAKKDFEKFYPDSTCTKHVMRFAVSLPGLPEIKINGLLSKYNLPDDYFFSPNQFWPHKNHITVIKAVEYLKQLGKECTVVFTGNEYTGNGDYAKGLKTYVQENGLNTHVHFLGFIDRSEQLLLMKHSKAVIQPSLFEGWSTVIEDAKALNKFLIVSDLPVHREQLNRNVAFFEPENFNVLSALLTAPSFPEASFAYNKDILCFAENFLQIIHLN